ncbi:uncharacterized protein LOC128165859 [Crassostrea angulata]|uniref:uncharacterized protein LOC128165859 n=1 Tax=Magallana angulata TaxID=2784310 RepID=UPI0022B1AF5B|nr:uncharacterized protein LOC128165859 [Crassostrea angulata]
MTSWNCDVIDMFRILAVGMLCLHVTFVTVVLIRHQTFEACISHYGTRGHMDSLLGTLAPGVRVCTLDRIRPLDIFNESVCLNLSGYNVHPTCHLNQAVEAPYRILLGGVIVLVLVSLTCYHLISHGLLINALANLGL